MLRLLRPARIGSIAGYRRGHPFMFTLGGQDYRVDYEPRESSTGLFGGNSNWRGPVWLPLNGFLMKRSASIRRRGRQAHLARWAAVASRVLPRRHPRRWFRSRQPSEHGHDYGVRFRRLVEITNRRDQSSATSSTHSPLYKPRALHGADFYRRAHQTIFEVVLDLYGRGEPVDAVTVAAELTKRGEVARIGGAPYLHTLISSVPTAANAGYYAKIVAERAILRRLVEARTRIVQLGYSGAGNEVDGIVDRPQAAIYDVTERRQTEDYSVLRPILPIRRLATTGPAPLSEPSWGRYSAKTVKTT